MNRDRFKPWIVPAIAVAQFAVMWGLTGFLVPAPMTAGQAWAHSGTYMLGDLFRALGAAALTVASFAVMAFLLLRCAARSAWAARMVDRAVALRHGPGFPGQGGKS